MRLAWYSNHPVAPTGYGGQTKQVTKRLLAAGHEVHVLSNYGGQQAGCGITDYNGITVWPQGVSQYSTETVDAQAAEIKPDFVFTLYDVWPMNKNQFRGFPTMSWVPVDHYPVGPEVVDWLRGTEQAGPRPAIAMSEFGQRAMSEAGIKSTYIPHAIEAHFRPTESDVRQRMQVPDDAFLIGINAANIGKFPPRKAWGENLQAVSALMHEHDDVYIYLHTDLQRPGGVDLPSLINILDMDPNHIRSVDPLSYRVGLTTEEDLAELYSTMDVLLAASAGEGFGIPVVEAMRCGTPAIVTDFSAQPEIVGDTGWRVEFQLQYDYGQGSFLATPYVPSIIAALNESYAERSTAAAVERSAIARERGDLYDADTVFEDKWLPLLDKMREASTRGKAAKSGLAVPASPGLVAPDGQPINRAVRPKSKKRKRSQKRGNQQGR